MPLVLSAGGAQVPRAPLMHVALPWVAQVVVQTWVLPLVHAPPPPGWQTQLATVPAFVQVPIPDWPSAQTQLTVAPLTQVLEVSSTGSPQLIMSPKHRTKIHHFNAHLLCGAQQSTRPSEATPDDAEPIVR